MNKLKYVAIAMVLGLSLFLSGCFKSETLEESVNNRWKGIIENDLESAYEYFSPGYKKIQNLLSFKNKIATAKINMNWKEANFVSSKCETESLCKVQVEVHYIYTFPRRSMGSTDSRSKVVESWINIDGRWYFVPKEN